LDPFNAKWTQLFREMSAAAANTFDFGLEQLVTIIRCRLDVFIIAVTAAACELRPMPAMGCESACESMAAASRLHGLWKAGQ
jgi:hypothetical protein